MGRLVFTPRGIWALKDTYGKSFSIGYGNQLLFSQTDFNLHPIAFISRFCTYSTSRAPASCPPRFQHRAICGYSFYHPLARRGPRKLRPSSTLGAKGEPFLHKCPGRGGGKRMFHDYFTAHLPGVAVKPEQSSKSRLVPIKIFPQSTIIRLEIFMASDSVSDRPGGLSKTFPSPVTPTCIPSV